jgi:hypothetical protein
MKSRNAAPATCRGFCIWARCFGASLLQQESNSMSVQISITENQLVEDLAAFFKTLVDCDVVRGLPGWVPAPPRECVVITPLAAQGLSVPVMAYADPSPAAGKRIMTQATQWSARVDGYGARALDLALTLSIALRSQYGCEFLGNLGRTQPLYAGERGKPDLRAVVVRRRPAVQPFHQRAAAVCGSPPRGPHRGRHHLPYGSLILCPFPPVKSSR